MKLAKFLVVFAGISSAVAGSYDDFFIAIMRDNPRTINQLLQRGFDPDTPDPRGRPALLLAIQDDSPLAARALVDWPKTKVEIRNAQDESPLMLAAIKGNDDLVAALIKRGADVNKPGWTPLHYACSGPNTAVVQRLLDENAYIDAESPNGSTPLMLASMYGASDSVKLLIASGADPTIKNKLGLTALDFAKRAGRDEIVGFVNEALRAWAAKRR